MNSRNHCGFGQVVRTEMSLKMRRQFLMQLELKHVEEMERAFDRDETMDPSRHYMVYNENKVLYFEDVDPRQVKAVKTVEPIFTWKTPITNQKKIDLKMTNETEELTKQLKHVAINSPEKQKAN